jgi:ABC transport system ATP-binding/permease protein
MEMPKRETLARRLARGIGLRARLPTPPLRVRRMGFWWLLAMRLGLVREMPTTAGALLPLLMKVFAAFTKLDGRIVEDEVGSALGFMRHDFPEAVHSELVRLYQEALNESLDLDEMALELARQLTTEEKILLGVQLFVLISRGERDQQQKLLAAFYLFMTNLGVASQAIDIVYQLNSGEQETGDAVPVSSGVPGDAPLESLSIAGSAPADLVFRRLSPNCRASAFRYGNLLLIKNTGRVPIIARGRRVQPGQFLRLYEGQRLLMEEVVFDHADLLSYFNAKKDVSGTQLYLTFTSGGGTVIDRNRLRDSDLRIRFGLDVRVAALRNTRATLGGRLLRAGVIVDATLDDRIRLPDESEISLAELRRRARELGGQFRLQPSKTIYHVSNDPSELEPGDILLSAGMAGDVLLRISCDYAEKTGLLEVLRSDNPVFLDRLPVKEKATLRDGDTIALGGGQFLRCLFGERVIEEQRTLIRRLEARGIRHRFDRRSTALDGIGFTVQRGEMVCVMGPSGCGKSTLLRVLAGQLAPGEGEVTLNGQDLYGKLSQLRPYLSFCPQDEAYDPLLTVEENVDFASAVRCPHLAKEARRSRADTKLVELGLNELRHRRAGTAQEKILSGGERRRLNAGLDMVSIADVFLFDEPTSGLSSKDSEYVLDIIHGLAHNKIIVVSIHQPSARLFRMFHKAILLDRGGKLVYFGTPRGMLDYFWRAYQDETLDAEAWEAERSGPAPEGLTPDFIFDVLETPLRDLGGDVIYERDRKGHLSPARRFPPAYWQDRFQAHELVGDVDRAGVMREGVPGEVPGMEGEGRAEGVRLDGLAPGVLRRGVKEHFVLFETTVRRAFLSKMRNRGNLAITLLEAPALAFLIAIVLRFSEDSTYTFASAFHIPTYLFLSLVVAMFLGLSNSADEVIRDRAMLNRERNQGVPVVYYATGKILSLSFFALLQSVIYLVIGNLVLEIREMFVHQLIWMFLTSVGGIGMGLVVSSLVHDSKTAMNIIPVLLIPQIILGGALIKYEEMNRNLDLVYALQPRIQGVAGGGAAGGGRVQSELEVPFLCEFMPLRWSYEAIIIAQAKLNPVTKTQRELNDLIKELVMPPPGSPTDGPPAPLTDEQLNKLDAAKDLLSFVSALKGPDVRTVVESLRGIRRSVEVGDLLGAQLELLTGDNTVTAESLYVNQKVEDLVTAAELERDDYRRSEGVPPNVFFSDRKTYLGRAWDTLVANGGVLVGFILLCMVTLWAILSRQLSQV